MIRQQLLKKITSHLAATAILLAAGAASILPGIANTSDAKIKFVSPEWVTKNLNDPHLRVLDVRNVPLDFIAGHVPGAVNIADANFRGPNGVLPVQYWDNQRLEDLFRRAGVNNNSRVLVYSDGNDVLGATSVAYLLERFGLKEINILDGGFTAYYNSGATVAQKYVDFKRGDFKIKDDASIRVSVQQLEKLTGKPGIEIVDPRPTALFRGDTKIWTRNGHIPGATNIPWQSFTQANNADADAKNAHKLKPLHEIRELLAKHNIKPTDDIIISCSTGREATLQYTVLKHVLGYPKVRVYEGSWTEYSTTNLPVETGPGKQ